MSDAIVVLFVFVAIFAGIISEKLDKTIIVLYGALILILTGYVGFHEAVHAIDFDTIGLLMGMMLLVECMKELKIFDWVALRLGILTRGDPVLIFLVFSIATAISSAFLDNVTTVLIVIPLLIALTQGIGLPPKLFVLSAIFLSNIGGTATLIGDPPNILIGSQVSSINFFDFIQYLIIPVTISTVLALLIIKITKRTVIQSRDSNFSLLFMSNLMLEQMKRQLALIHIPQEVLWKALGVFLLVLLGFFTHAITHVEPAIIAMTGAVVMLGTFHKRIDLHHLIAHIEWPTLLFFAGLFMIVGCMEHVGLLHMIADLLVSLTDDLWVMLMIVLFSAAILSALVDNIPFVAVMIPILKQLTSAGAFAGHPKAYLLWWALSLGACFGGNGSMIGASANVIGCAIARSKGVEIGFKEFLIQALPVTVMSIIVSAIYLTVLYHW